MPPKPGFETETADGGEYARIPTAAGLSAPTAGTYWRTLRNLRWSQLGYLALRRALPRSHSPVRIKEPVGFRYPSGRWRLSTGNRKPPAK